MLVDLIVKFHEGGFFSNFNKVTTFIEQSQKELVQISSITWDLRGQPYGAFAYNLNEVFGAVFTNYNNNRVANKTIILEKYPHTRYTGKEVHKLYTNNSYAWRYSLNKTLKYILPRTEVIEKISIINNTLKDKKIIGVLKRNNLLKCEQVNNKLPTLQDYFSYIDKHFNEDTYLYLSVDNIYDLNSFIKRYKRCIYNPKMRRTNTDQDTEPHFTPGTSDDAINTFLEVISLSKCSTFLHPISNMATAVLYYNPEIKSIYLQ